MSKKGTPIVRTSDDTSYDEIGFPYNPRYSTGTTPLPTLRPLVNKTPTIPIYDYGKLYIPGEGKICAHKYFPQKFKQIMQERIAEEQKKAALLQAQSGQPSPEQDGQDEDVD